MLTTQTDALRHVCLYGIHMLSWEIRGQRHTARIHDGSAETISMAPARARTRPCGGAYFWSIHRHSFAPQLSPHISFCLALQKVWPQAAPAARATRSTAAGEKRHFSKLSQVLKTRVTLFSPQLLPHPTFSSRSARTTATNYMHLPRQCTKQPRKLLIPTGLHGLGLGWFWGVLF